MSSPNVQFTQIPDGIRKPQVAMEYNTKNAISGLVGKNDSVVAIAQRLSTGTIAAKTPTKVFSDADAALYFGQGSIAHLVALYAFQANPYINLSIVGVDDAGTAVQAYATITPTASATGGAINLYIGDILIGAAYATTDTTNALLGAKLNTAIVDSPDYYKLPVTSAVDAGTGVITLTAKNGGTLGNHIALSLANTGTASFVVTAMANGANDPVIGPYSSAGTVLATIAGAGYSIVINTLPFAAQLAHMKAFIDFVSGPLEQRPAVSTIGLTDLVDSYADLETLCGTTLNHWRTTAAYVSYASGVLAKAESFKIAAAYGAAIASQSDIALPYDDMVLVGIPAPAVADRFTRTQQEDLLHNGVTPLYVVPGEQVAIVRSITTYVKNAGGNVDPALLDITTPRTLDEFRFQVVTRLKLRFIPSKLTAKKPAQVVTQVLDVMYLMQGIDQLKNVDTYKNGVIAEIDSGDPTRINVKIPAPIVPGLHIITGIIDLILS
jgi:phage tail sheath gpL-like